MFLGTEVIGIDDVYFLFLGGQDRSFRGVLIALFFPTFLSTFLTTVLLTLPHVRSLLSLQNLSQTNVTLLNGFDIVILDLNIQHQNHSNL